MSLKPRTDLTPNTADFEQLPYIKPSGFPRIRRALALSRRHQPAGLPRDRRGLASVMRAHGVPARIVVGHDYRSYSCAVKQALIAGLLAGGAEVHDIGLALSPMAYFAQFALGWKAWRWSRRATTRTAGPASRWGCNRP